MYYPGPYFLLLTVKIEMINKSVESICQLFDIISRKRKFSLKI